MIDLVAGSLALAFFLMWFVELFRRMAADKQLAHLQEEYEKLALNWDSATKAERVLVLEKRGLEKDLQIQARQNVELQKKLSEAMLRALPPSRELPPEDSLIYKETPRVFPHVVSGSRIGANGRPSSGRYSTVSAPPQALPPKPARTLSPETFSVQESFPKEDYLHSRPVTGVEFVTEIERTIETAAWESAPAPSPFTGGGGESGGGGSSYSYGSSSSPDSSTSSGWATSSSDTDSSSSDTDSGSSSSSDD